MKLLRSCKIEKEPFDRQDFSPCKIFEKKYVIMVLLLSLATAAASILPFAAANGFLFSLRDDFDYQQVTFGLYFSRLIKSGGLTGWAWGSELGNSAIAGFSFYNLFSPFTWLLSIFPEAAFPYLFPIQMIIKYAAAAFFAYCYAARFVRKNEYAVFAAILYAFCGQNAMNIIFPFMDVVALFPLLLIALEETVKNKKFGAFAAAVTLLALTNYYFLWAEAIFLIIYYIFRFLLTDFKNNVKKVPQFIFEGLLGVGAAGIAVIPSIMSVLGNSRISRFSVQLRYSLYQYFHIASAYLMPSGTMGDSALVEGFSCDSCAIWLPCFGISLLLAYFIKHKKSTLSLLSAACVIISLVPVLNGSFAFFNELYYARWFFMPTLVFALCSAVALDEGEAENDSIKDDKSIQKGIIINGILTFCMCAGVFLLQYISNKNSMGKTLFYVAFALAAWALGALALTIKKGKLFARVISAVIICAVIMNISAIYIYKKGRGSVQDTGEFYETLTDFSEELSKTLPKEGNYRIKTAEYGSSDYIKHSRDNISLLTDISSADGFNSTCSPGLFEFYRAMGIERNVDSCQKDYPGLWEALSCRYYLSGEKTEKTPVLSYIYKNGKTVYLYEYDAFLPIGYTHDRYITEEDFMKYDTEDKALILLNAAVIDEKDVKTAEKYAKKVTEEEISALEKEKISDYISSPNRKISENFEKNPRGFSCKITCDKASLAYFSVPDDGGFSAKINGSEAPIIHSNGMILLPLEAGENEIVFAYETPGLRIGTASTVACFTVIILGFVLSKRRENK